MTEYKPLPEYANIIVALMEEKGETQEKLAAAIGVNRDRVNNWLNGRSKLDYENLIRIAKHYGRSTDYILGLSTVEIDDKDMKTVEAVTGLPGDVIQILSYCNNVQPHLLSPLKYLLRSSAWIPAFNEVAQAVSSLRVYKIQGKPQNNIEAFTAMQDLISQAGLDAKDFDNSTVPQIPQGTMLLSAADASEYYKNKAVSILSDVLDDYISKASEPAFYRKES